MGFASVDGAARAPFRWPKDDDTPDEDEQADAYRALFREASGWPWFGGLFIWKMKIGVEANNASERLFVFQGKKAEAVIKAGFLRHLSRAPR